MTGPALPTLRWHVELEGVVRSALDLGGLNSPLRDALRARKGRGVVWWLCDPDRCSRAPAGISGLRCPCGRVTLRHVQRAGDAWQSDRALEYNRADR